MTERNHRISRDPGTRGLWHAHPGGALACTRPPEADGSWSCPYGTRKAAVAFAAREELRKWLEPGDTIFVVLRRVSASGMSRLIDVYVIKDNEPRWLTLLVAEALGWPFREQDDAMRVSGAGMDMGFHVSYSLGQALWPKGHGDEPHGGYLLKRRWL